MRSTANVRTLTVVTVLLFAAGHLHAQPDAKRKALVTGVIDSEIKSLDVLYKHLHNYPELSFEEEKTAARLAKELRTLGFVVTEKVGGHGIVGVLKNGDV